MKQCWTEGELRAYFDGELPAADRDRVAAHLAECGQCESQFQAVSHRAQRVAAALGELAGSVATGRPRPAVTPVRWWPRWSAAAAVAAALALLLMSPKAPPPAPPAVALDTGGFVALDNEPIDAGLVMRVSLGPNQVQADVIVTADGRARAYRLVGNQN